MAYLSTKFINACRDGYTEKVKLLLADPRVDPSAVSNYAIQTASANGRTETVEILLADPRVDPSNEDNQAIQWATEKGHTEIVRLLQEAIDKRNKKGE